MAAKQKTYLRFNVLQRVEHWVMTLSFALLAITGLPQRYALSGWAEWLLSAFGGIESTRIIHRGAAIVLGAIAFVHLVELAYKLYVLRLPATMMPGVKDGLDIFNVARYNLGLSKEHPKLPRYNFAEKLEYLAVVWGTVMMGITGFMLWNPIGTTKALPGQFVPAAKVAHSLEALLAVLAIIVWHLYSVHLKTFNTSIFNGKLTREQMAGEHSAELAEIDAGKRPAAVPPAVKRKRQIIFFPIAAVFLVAATVFLYLFATFEQTAIATVPRAESAQAFVPTAPTATPALTPTKAAAVPTAIAKPASIPQIRHPVADTADCLQCHDAGDIKPMPADHYSYPAKLCIVCHKTEQNGPLPPGMLHAVEGRTACAACHVKAQQPKSHQPVDISDAECLTCHVVDKEALAKMTVPITQPTSAAQATTAAPQPTAAATGAAQSTAAAPAGAVSFAKDIQPAFKAKCEMCHGTQALGGLKLNDYAAVMAGGTSGKAVVAGDPDTSPIVVKMKAAHPAVLDAAELQKLVDWIKAGAKND